MLLVLAGCQKDVQAPNEESSSTLTSANAKGAPNVPLIVTVIDRTTDNGYRISSDGASYINGQQLVEAVLLASDGNFYLNTNSNTAKATLRWLIFYDETLSGTTSSGEFYNKTMNGLPNYSLRTTIADGAAPIQSMIEGSFQYVGFRIWGVKLKGVVDWRLVYKNGYESDYWNTASTTDYAKVTRVSATQWTIEPASHATAALYPGNATSPSDRLGYHVVPFKLILNKK